MTVHPKDKNVDFSGKPINWLDRLTSFYRQDDAPLASGSDTIKGLEKIAFSSRDNDFFKTLEHLHEGVYRSSLDGKQVYANKALVALNGYQSMEEMTAAVVDIATEWYVDPDRRRQFHAELEKSGFVRNFVSEIYRHKTRERIWISENARLVCDPKTGKGLYYEGSVREVTDRVIKEKQERSFGKLANRVPGGLFILVRHKSGGFRAEYASPRFCEMVGVEGVDQQTDPSIYLNRIHPEDRSIYLSSLQRSGIELSEWRCEFRICNDNGDERWLSLEATPERRDNSIVWYGYLHDATDRKQKDAHIAQLANFDALTGLLNRRGFLDQLSRRQANFRRNGKHGTVLFIDLDEFKILNDTFGHAVGDQLLVGMTKRLQDAVCDDCLVARFGGDEFVVLCSKGFDTEQEAKDFGCQLSDAILHALDEVFHLGDIVHRTTCSIGVSLLGRSAPSADAVLAHADQAMYEAKHRGRNTYAVFDGTMAASKARTYRLMQELQSAIRDGQFSLHFQPQVNTKGQIVAAEALARWEHPELGMISPGEFIPMLEQSGQILNFSTWTLQQAFSTLEKWAQHPVACHLTLSLNMSPKCFMQEAVWRKLVEIVDLHKNVSSRLVLEVTESVAASNKPLLNKHMDEMRAYGISFSIDDFGTGFSSLSYLKHLSFSELKIDQSFVRELVTSDIDRQLVKTIINVAKALGMVVVAEHVEDQDQEDVLRELNCDMFQGYRYSPAIPEARFIELAERMAGANSFFPRAEIKAS